MSYICCTAGKDRTGVVSAILRHKIGMDSEYIIEDYMKSKDNLKDMFQKLSQVQKTPQLT